MTIFEEYTEVLLNEEYPSAFFNNQLQHKSYPTDKKISMLYKLSSIEQNKKFHPEGNVWNHVMMVVDEAAKRKVAAKDPKVFMWAALLHDIGKLTTTKMRKGRWTSYNHDIEGKELARDILSELTDDQEFIEEVIAYVRWHMQPLFVNKNLSFKTIDKMKEDISPEKIGLLSVCDRLGRGGLTEDGKMQEIEDVDSFIQVANKEKIKN